MCRGLFRTIRLSVGLDRNLIASAAPPPVAETRVAMRLPVVLEGQYMHLFIASSLCRSVAFGVLLAAFAAMGCERNQSNDSGGKSDGADSTAAEKGGDPVARGKYLVTIGGCNDCHTPWKMGEKGPEPDMTLMLSGHPQAMVMPEPPKSAGPWLWGGAATNTAYHGPWGVSFAMNLTPDSVTGIGSWSEATFIEAIRTGKHMGKGRPIMPPMPWPAYRNMTDEDLKGVYAYLRTIPVIKNQVPEYIPPKEGAPAM